MEELRQRIKNLILGTLRNQETQIDIDECFKKIENGIPESIFHEVLWELIDDDKIEVSPNAKLSLKTAPPQ